MSVVGLFLSLSFLFLFNESRQKDAYGGHLKDVNPLGLASSLMDPYMKRTTVVLLEQMTWLTDEYFMCIDLKGLVNNIA